MSEVGRPITPGFRSVVILSVLGFCGVGPAWAQTKTYGLTSPNGSLSLKVDVGKKILWSVRKGDQVMIEPSAISMQIADGPVLGNDARVVSDRTDKVDTQFDAINYVRAVVRDSYNQLTLELEGELGVVFRAYDDAVAYRFFTKKRGELIVKSEEANFNFTDSRAGFRGRQAEGAPGAGRRLGRDRLQQVGAFEADAREARPERWAP